MFKNTTRIALLTACFLALPFLASRMTPPIVLPIPTAKAAPAPPPGDCTWCQQNAQYAWFEAYDLARANGRSVDQCLAAGDKARDCFVAGHWNDSCSACGGVMPECNAN